MATAHEMRQLLENVQTQVVFLRQFDEVVSKDLDDVVTRLQKLKADLPQDVLGESTIPWDNIPPEAQEELHKRLLFISKALEALTTVARYPSREETKRLLRYVAVLSGALLIPIFLSVCKFALPLNLTYQVHPDPADPNPTDPNPTDPDATDPDADDPDTGKLERGQRAEEILSLHPAWMWLLIICLGAFGGCLRVVSSVVVYIGTRRLYRSWLIYYYMAPLEGAVLAVIVCLLVGGGVYQFPAQNQNGVDLSALESAHARLLYLYALAGFSGLFAKNVLRKLKEVCDAIFGKPSSSDAA